ncbi:MAG: hypothetical protein Tsb0034_09270 [Ekhidna sp.]
MYGLNRWIGTLFLVLISSATFSQNLYKLYGKAEEIFYNEDFANALAAYREIEAIDSTYEDIRYKMEICKLLSDRQYTDMSTFLSYESTMSRRDKFYHYWKGRVQLEEYQFEEAIESLNTFINSPAKKSDEILLEARRWIKWSETAKMHMDNPEYYEIHLLEQGINTRNAELSPVFFADKEELLFLSNRDESNPDEFKIYHTVHEGERKWSTPTTIINVGTFTRDNANIEVVDEDGRLFQFRTNKGGDLYFSEPTDSREGWSDPEEFDSKISSTHLSSHFFINEHEDRIIFAKDVGSKKKPNLDLYESFKDHETGKWGTPSLFATSINSEFNEDSPYLSPDESTIYFASDGHETMGGYDIFKSTYDSATQSWSEPVNLGFPVNSPDDEIHFKLNPDQTSGYFTSNRLNTYGDFDIFFFWEIHTIKIKGRVIDGPTGQPVTDARIFFRPVEYTDMYFYSEIDNDGQYQTEITSDDVFNIEVKMADKSIIKLEDFEIHATDGLNTTYIKDFYIGEVPPKPKESTPVADAGSNQGGNAPAATSQDRPNSQPNRPTREVEIEDLGRLNGAKGKAVVRNIYFDFGDTRVTDESLPILNRLLNLMESYPQLSIIIAGHTDNIGENEVNQTISELRAKAVKNWLVSKGVASNRVETRGYGETQPMATNDDEFEGRELNRRIEIYAK